jgi:hypothetical protein
MRRQLAASGAAVATALAIGVAMLAVPAHANHEVPELVKDNPTCADIGLVALFPKVEPPVDVVNEFVTADVSADGKFLDVEAKDGFVITAVIVKAGPDANVYDQAPFHDMHAPLVGQDSNIPTISHYEICGEEGEETTPPTTPPTTDTPPPTMVPTTPVDTPAPVPTEVPAGTNTGGSDSLGLWGLIAGTCAAVAGAAVVVRRRFLHDS